MKTKQSALSITIYVFTQKPIEVVWQTRTTSTAATHLNCRNHWTRLISCGCDIDCSSSVPQILASRPTPPRVSIQTWCNNQQPPVHVDDVHTAEDGIQGESKEKLISCIRYMERCNINICDRIQSTGK